ncbi:DNA repair protein RecN [Eubacterium sp. OM08-24]|jgi:DNA repair protein RecN (Recombination protein N)|uniref:DNA repair protein RecN n=1 Tax=Eubacterium sp. OM08-24 TaxID=2292352 RepID=UPI000E43FA08|nr:DNA repair protein RecN [Eubacterium sp. OM08-24]RGM21553.1 DNA repair protein RecN [Eubacterium sp. OM08-24]
MLTTLYIENIAVIEKTSIDFSQGLNVLTGETGAGKSIIIDSINAIMGQRTSKELVRTGAKTALVTAQFDDVNDTVKAKLKELGYDNEDDDTLILQRSISAAGKSTCKINARPASVTVLKEVAKNLINIHGQHESYELFSPDTHIDYIDSFGELNSELDDYREKYKRYKALKKQLNEANSDESARLHEIDLLTYQTTELFNADVQPDEIEQLENERIVLMNSEKIFTLLNDARELLDGDERTAGGVESVESAMNYIQRAASLNGEYESISESITDVYYNLRDCIEAISDAADSVESDPQRLEEIDERLDLLNRLTRKYGCECNELPSLAEKMQTRLEELLSYDKNRDQLEADYQEAENNALVAAQKLSEIRKKTAKVFSERVREEMSFLNMPNVQIVTQFENTDFYEKGTDKIEFLISANPGEPPRPVAKIASGGELSRMMLAIKTVLASTDDIDTLIFDEVDTGISGSAAQKVGMKLKEVSKSSQVLCVTHQAQLAALADAHYLISKQVEDGRTFTQVKLLDFDGRKHELARIIGGVSITDAALAHAESMLKESEEL